MSYEKDSLLFTGYSFAVFMARLDYGHAYLLSSIVSTYAISQAQLNIHRLE